MRTIRLSIDQETLAALEAKVGRKNLYTAIGYLSTWGMNYPEAVIVMDGKKDLLGYYKDEVGETKYTIGAVWNDDTDAYGFHS